MLSALCLLTYDYLVQTSSHINTNETSICVIFQDDVKEVIKVDDDLDEIQRNYNLNFLRRGLPPLELVPAMDRKTMAALEKLPKKVYSPHYKADITVVELRDAMWQNRTWQGATKYVQ